MLILPRSGNDPLEKNLGDFRPTYGGACIGILGEKSRVPTIHSRNTRGRVSRHRIGSHHKSALSGAAIDNIGLTHLDIGGVNARQRCSKHAELVGMTRSPRLVEDYRGYSHSIAYTGLPQEEYATSSVVLIQPANKKTQTMNHPAHRRGGANRA